MPRIRYPQPGNEDEFEEFCLRFYRVHLDRGGLARYGKRGETQHGIDLIDQHAKIPRIAVQCKHRESNKTLTPAEISAEAILVESAPHDVDRYIIATTAKKSKRAHDRVVELNQREDQRCKIEIHFWEDICAFLVGFRRAHADFILYGERDEEQSHLIASVSINSNTLTSDSDLSSTGLGDFEALNDLFDQRKLEAAAHEIGKLPDPESDRTLDGPICAAIYRLKAKLSMEEFQFEKAASLFNRAYDADPTNIRARQNRVLAIELAGDKRATFSEASKLIKDEIRTGFIASLLVRNAEGWNRLTPFKDLIEELAEECVDVNLALVQKYLEWGELNKAQTAVDKAAQLAPDTAHAHFWKGMVYHHVGLNGNWQHRFDNLTNATQSYTAALVACERDSYRGLIPEILVNRGRVHSLIGDCDQAAADFRRAAKCSSRPSVHGESAVNYFLHMEDYVSARELLDVLDGDSLGSEFLKVAINCHFSADDEKSEHIESMRRLADADFDRAEEARCFGVQWAINSKEFELGRNFLCNEFLENDPFSANTLSAWLELEAGNHDVSRARAVDALSSSAKNAHKQMTTILGRVLVWLDDDADALPLFEHAATPGVLDENTKLLITCSQRLKKDDVLIRVCEELYETGQQDNAVRSLHVQLLSKYRPIRARELAEEFRVFDDSYFSAASNFLAVRLGLPEEIKFDLKALPRPCDFSSREAYLVLRPLIEIERYFEAVDFAYHNLRLNFDSELSHGQYITLFHDYGNKAGISVAQNVVQENSGVRIKNCTTDQSRWVVIEDDSPDSRINEVQSHSTVARELIGKSVGDLVNTRGDAIQKQEEIVEEVVSKYVYRFRDSLNEFEHRFPDSGSFQKVHLGGDGAIDVTPLIESLGHKRESVDAQLKLYQENIYPIHAVAVGLGFNLLHLIENFADHDDRFIRCVDTTPSGLLEVSQQMSSFETLVLDLSAIVTIWRLKGWECLDEAKTYLVSRSSWNRVLEWHHSLTKIESQPKAISYLTDDGRLGFHDITPEQRELEQADVQCLVETIDAHCTKASSSYAARIDPSRRKELVELIGYDALESLCIAKDEDATLWTDDQYTGVIAETEFQCNRVWTQAAFQSFQTGGVIDAKRFSLISAQLAAWSYQATVWKPVDIVSAGEICDWDTQAFPLRQCIGLIASSSVSRRQKAVIIIEFLRALRQSSCSEFVQTSVVQASLNSLDDSQAARWILQRIDDAFHIDIIGANIYRSEIEGWLRLR